MNSVIRAALIGLCIGGALFIATFLLRILLFAVLIGFAVRLIARGRRHRRGYSRFSGNWHHHPSMEEHPYHRAQEIIPIDKQWYRHSATESINQIQVK